MATAASNVNKRSWVKIKIDKIEKVSEFPVFPRRVRRRWPAIIFAERRIAKVPGRIIFLIVSIKTMKGIRIKGVPWGIKWINMCFVLLIHPYNMNLNQRGRANERVKVIWLVEVKM